MERRVLGVGIRLDETVYRVREAEMPEQYLASPHEQAADRGLERLARTYWRFLERWSLGLIRVRYAESERSVVLVARPLKLLSFHAPEYETGPTRGLVRWRIARGLLVSSQGHDGDGYLQIEVRRYPGAEPSHARLHVEVAVANFYPSIASRLGLRLYNATQSRIHVIVTYGFLRSLARLDLAESRVGHYRGDPRASGG